MAAHTTQTSVQPTPHVHMPKTPLCRLRCQYKHDYEFGLVCCALLLDQNGQPSWAHAQFGDTCSVDRSITRGKLTKQF